MQKINYENVLPNFYVEIKLCLVLDTFLMFLNKNGRYHCK